MEVPDTQIEDTEEIRLTQPARIELAKQALQAKGALLLIFAAQRTRYQVLLVNDTVLHMGGGVHDCKGYCYVSLVEFGGSYPLKLAGYLDPGYVASKLRTRGEADANNVTALLNALGHPDGAYHYLTNIPLFGDHVNHSRVSGGGFHVQRR